MKKYIYIIMMSMVMVSCVDTYITPYGQTVEDDYWKTKSEVRQIVTKAYSELAASDVVERMIVWGGFRSDELLLTSEVPATNSTRQALSEIKTANIETTNTYNNWSSIYSVINLCNLVIEMAPTVVDVDPDYTQGDCLLDIAQMKSLRSLCYFYLVRVFRDVPYITVASRNSSQEMNFPQSAPSVVLQACIDDLTEAAKDIYDAQNFALSNWRARGYLNRDAVYTLLADIYLWRASVLLGSNPEQAYSDYQNCVDYATLVIDSKNEYHSSTIRGGQTVDQDNPYPALATIENYMNELFVKQNAEESIFELEFKSANTAIQHMYYGYGGTNYSYGFMQAPGLFGSLGTSNDNYIWIQSYDTRKKSVYYDSSNADEFYSIRKMVSEATDNSDPSSYKFVREGGLSSWNHDWIIYRMTDVMLMKAEAMTELAGRDGDEAMLEEAFNIVQAVNHRALYQGSGVKELAFSTYSTVDDMESLILAERLRELCFEGKRWFDLLRMNYRNNAKLGVNTNYDLILADQDELIENNASMLNMMARTSDAPTAIISKMKTEPYLYMPIYESELRLNENLKQNPVYSTNNQFERND